LAAEWSNGHTHVDEIANKFNTHLSLIFGITNKFNTHHSLIFGNLEKQSTKVPGLTSYETRFTISVRGIATAGRDKIWSLKVLGLPKETLLSLMRRQESCTIIEYERILKYVTHPCNKFVSLVKTNQYDLRTGRIQLLEW
jgi:hypothetical protein